MILINHGKGAKRQQTDSQSVNSTLLLILTICAIGGLGCILALVLWAVFDHRRRSREPVSTWRPLDRRSPTPSAQ